MGNIFSRRNVLSMFIISLLMMLCTIVTAVGLFAECVTNYSNLMPVYDGSEIIESESSLLNYLGLGNLRTVWFVKDESATVQQWFAETLSNQRRASREAERAGEKPPPLWDGAWRVEPAENGANIYMQATCY